jgi:hypothetical protein
MEDHEKNRATSEVQDNQNDCGCEGDCCPPKKHNRFAKIIFAVIILAAIGIIAVKVFRQPEPAAVKEAACCPSGSASGCDTTKTATCDTTKGSSCCPKK